VWLRLGVEALNGQLLGLLGLKATDCAQRGGEDNGFVVAG